MRVRERAKGNLVSSIGVYSVGLVKGEKKTTLEMNHNWVEHLVVCLC